MERITKVTAGQRVAWHGPMGTEPGWTEVTPGCGDKNGGYWYCVTHAEPFQNQMQKDGHISEYAGPRKRHQLAWICYAHGAEVP